MQTNLKYFRKIACMCVREKEKEMNDKVNGAKC